MNGKPFFDTNVLLYAFAAEDPRRRTAQTLMARGGVISVQILNEFVAVTHRKIQLPWDRLLSRLAQIETNCPSPAPITLATHKAALRICERYQYHIYDSLVIAAALETSCQTLYSEDLQDGQIIEGLTIRNPFRVSVQEA